MPKARKRRLEALRNPKIDFVSVVDRPANRPSQIVLWKRDTNTPDGKVPAGQRTARKSASKGGHLMSDRTFELEELPEDARAHIEKTEGQVQELTEQVETLTTAAQEHEDQSAKIAALEAQVAELTPQEETPTEDVTVGMSKAAKERFEKLEKENQEARERVIVLEKAARKDRFQKQAEPLVENLPVQAEELGPLLDAVDALDDKDVAELLDKVLKSANEAGRQARLTQEQGQDEFAGGDAWARIEKSAAAKVAASDGKISKEQATDLVLREQPELYDEYLAEKRH